MNTAAEQHPTASPMRLLEVLSDRFGVFEAVAFSSIKLSRVLPETELSMDPLVAEAVLEFGSDLRAAWKASNKWAQTKGIVPPQPETVEEYGT
jgi:hypothetical protein